MPVSSPILQIALPTPLNRLFDYLPPAHVNVQQIKIGMRVKVPFQSRILIGIILNIKEKSDIPSHKLKSAFELIDETPLFTEEILKLCDWATNYYHDAIGEVIFNAIPPYLRQGKILTAEKLAPDKKVWLAETPPILNPEQMQAVSQIRQSSGFQVFLLHGITGSGKTEVYLQLIDERLRQDKQALVLIPEIGLTPQTVTRFQARFNVPIALLHSAIANKKRAAAWLAAKEGTAKIIIGTRSAIFTPCANLGVIIVDEEHDGSYKQQDRFRYHARDVAVKRASLANIPIVLGSATPSFESFLNAKRSKYQYLTLNQRALTNEITHYTTIDLRQENLTGGLSDTLINAIKKTLAEENQVLLFLNRRGFAPLFYCPACAHRIHCKRCDAHMVFHTHPERLQCHHCQAKMTIPTHCPDCKSSPMLPVGIGTERIDEYLQKIVGDVPIIRLDRDTTQKKGSLEEALKKIHQEKKAILLGTQMLAKGHHFPQVTLVGIIDADSGLFSSDFRALEQMGQLLLQVAGRAGRAEKKGEVFIQTRHPHHPFLHALLQQDFASFANELLAERQALSLPPFTYFAILRAEAHHEKKAQDFLLNAKKMGEKITKTIDLLGPMPALIAKKQGKYSQHLIIKANQRQALQQFLNQLQKEIEQDKKKSTVKWHIDVDPLEI